MEDIVLFLCLTLFNSNNFLHVVGLKYASHLLKKFK